jgi:hypothetical protein
MRVAKALLPPLLIEHLEQPTVDNWQAREKEMLSVSTLIVKLIKGTILSVEIRNIRELDANPGDKGCQLRAVILKELVLSPTVSDELKRLDETVKSIEKVLQKRKTVIKLRTGDDSSCQFFQRHILPIEVSVDLLYLIYCKLLTVTKVKHCVLSNGIVVTRLDHSKLAALSPTIGSVDNDLRKQIIDDASANLSEDSLTRLQGISRKMHVSPLLLRMLVDVRKINKGDFKPKSFGCQFYEVQMVLTHLRQQEAVIAIKTVVTEGTPQLLLLKPSAPGEEFRFVEDVPKDALLVVFEGVLQKGLSIDTFKAKVQEIGFSRLILVCTAQEEPYEHGSTLDSVTDPEARAEIESHIKMASVIDCVKDKNPLLLMDHIFCNSLEAELKTLGKLC